MMAIPSFLLNLLDANVRRQMKTIIYNIGTLAGILPEGTLKLDGRQMDHVECIEDAYLVIED